jgi:hypothetical protein
VLQSDGLSGAPFAYVREFRVYRLLWWNIKWLETSQGTDFNGNVTFNLSKGARYYIDASWLGTDGRVRSNSVEFVLVTCPGSQQIVLPS